MKHEDFGDHEFYFVQRWVRVVREGSETYGIEDSKDKEEGREVTIGSDSCETLIHADNWEGINDLLDDSYEVDDDRLLDPKNKFIPKGDIYLPVYKEGCKWSVIDYSRAAVCWRDAEKRYGMNE